MHLWILLKEFLVDIRTQKTRAILTTIAITWGTLTMILLMAFGSGLSFRMQEGMRNAWNRVLLIYSDQTSKKYQGLPVGRRINLSEIDFEILQENLKHIEGMSPQMGKWVRLKNGDKIASTYMEGVYPSFEFLRRMYPTAGGRFLNEQDVELRKRVVFMGPKIAEQMFGNPTPIGETIFIDGIPFTVVGTMPKKLQTSMSNGPDDERAIIPFSTFKSIYGYRYLHTILVKPAQGVDNKKMIQEIRTILGRKHKFDPTDDKALPIWDFEEIDRLQGKIFLGIMIFLGVIGAMTLVIAGVGVANIMYVVVKERTHEIGIKRAVGAHKKHILSQFIFESLLISIIGGSTGLLFALGIIKIIWMLPAQQGAMQFLGRPLVSHSVVIVTITVLTLIGLLAGLFPARKAANVDPVEALRYE